LQPQAQYSDTLRTGAAGVLDFKFSGNGKQILYITDITMDVKATGGSPAWVEILDSLNATPLFTADGSYSHSITVKFNTPVVCKGILQLNTTDIGTSGNCNATVAGFIEQI
jgi:hypothetical protein